MVKIVREELIRTTSEAVAYRCAIIVVSNVTTCATTNAHLCASLCASLCLADAVAVNTR